MYYTLLSQLDNRYMLGSEIGAITASNRAAYKRRANNSSDKKPCCDKK